MASKGHPSEARVYAAGDLIRVRIDRDPIPRSFNEPDKVRPMFDAISKERFGKGIKAVRCFVNPATGNTNTLLGSGDGKVGPPPPPSHWANRMRSKHEACFSPSVHHFVSYPRPPGTGGRDQPQHGHGDGQEHRAGGRRHVHLHCPRWQGLPRRHLAVQQVHSPSTHHGTL